MSSLNRSYFCFLRRYVPLNWFYCTKCWPALTDEALPGRVRCFCISTTSSKIAFPTGKEITAPRTHPEVAKWHPVSCAHRAHTSMHPRKTLGTQNPNIQFLGDLSAWDNNAAPALMRDHKTVLFARLHLLAVPFPSWSSPSSHLQSHSSLAECDLHTLP